MKISGLSVETLDYTFTRYVHICHEKHSRNPSACLRWDPRWWSLTLNLKNGTVLGLPTTGYWPYSGDSGLEGVTAPLHDAGTFGVVDADQTANASTLDLGDLPSGGSIIFFDNPSPTRNYSSPGYSLLG